jgi:ABC-type transport system involved in multi-copper enzyme maturation permease subunit
MTSAILAILWIFSQALKIALYFWPLSILLILHAVVAVLLSRPSASLLALLVPFIWPILILLVAAAWWNIGDEISEVPQMGVAALFCIQVILSIGITYELRGRRWAATSVCMVALWLGALSWFVAGMALTNVWL